MKKFEIFLDSDGVLAGFDQKVLEFSGKLPSQFEKKKNLWEAIEHYDKNVEQFFLSLPKMDGADELIEFCINHFDSVKILTASGYSPKDCKEQKIAWYAKHYPDLECIVVPKSPDKATYAHPDAILIDDRMKSIEPWQASGGIGILHTSAKTTIEQLQKLLE